uniref:Uncharacterized protein n=1 Tax=Anguilla anguilla TaxID=7936 RepID=A0A0E9R680_ANGAN
MCVPACLAGAGGRGACVCLC